MSFADVAKALYSQELSHQLEALGRFRKALSRLGKPPASPTACEQRGCMNNVVIEIS